MSYSIFVGNAELDSEWGSEPSARWIVRKVEHPEAPIKPDLTGRTNGTHPGYSQFAEFCEDVGLRDVFGDLMRDHPGIAQLTRAHLVRFEAARRAYALRHPSERPAYCECAECDRFGGDPAPAHDPTANVNMLKLDWLIWWTRRALDTCERPAIYNY